MLKFANLHHMIISPIYFDSPDKILLVKSCTKFPT